MTSPVFGRAQAVHQAGRLAEAESLYRQVLREDSGNADAHHLLGVATLQQGRVAEALDAIGRAIALRPAFAEAHSDLGSVLQAAGRLSEAVTSHERAIALKPGNAIARANLGNSLCALGRFSEGETQYRFASELNAGIPEIHCNLGNALREQGRLAEARESYLAAISLRPQFAQAHNNLGNIYRVLGQYSAAEESYRAALDVDPGLVDVLYSLASVLLATGRPREAAAHCVQGLRAKVTSAGKSVFIKCVKAGYVGPDRELARQALLAALVEPWTRVSEITAPLAKFLLAGDGGEERLRDLPAVAADQLVIEMLKAAPVTSIVLEDLFCAHRRTLLESLPAVRAQGGMNVQMRIFAAALAQQCFINEYIYPVSDAEAGVIAALEQRIGEAANGKKGASFDDLVILAAYMPLGRLSAIDALKLQLPPELTDLIVQQVLEPREERALAPAVPQFAKIREDVSRAVQDQYEANPYPRWVRAEPADTPKSLREFFRTQFPQAEGLPAAAEGRLDVLVAGCGTGLHPIATARAFANAHVLGADLSRTSLAYATRKSKALGLKNIDYAQGDLLEIASTGKVFDVVEAVGVLHHMADPWEGWRRLLCVLRPGGVMRLGLYSAIARREIAEAGSYLKGKKSAATAASIRAARQELIAAGTFGSVYASQDFFSVSACRDLLFHVQEHRMTLIDIAKFLDTHGLRFIGFSIDAATLHDYHRDFPGDVAATNLQNWHFFEQANPETFAGMYQFWIVKEI